LNKHATVIDWIGYGIAILLIVISGVLDLHILFSIACGILCIKGTYVLAKAEFDSDIFYWINVLYVICFWILMFAFLG